MFWQQAGFRCACLQVKLISEIGWCLMILRVLVILSLTGVAACTTFPEVDTAESALVGPNSAPALLPIDELLAMAAASPDAYSAGSSVADRSALLAARAAALRAR